MRLRNSIHCKFIFIFCLLRSFFAHNFLTHTTTLDKSRPGSNDKEEVLHTPQIYRTGASPLAVLVISRIFIGGWVLYQDKCIPSPTDREGLLWRLK